MSGSLLKKRGGNPPPPKCVYDGASKERKDGERSRGKIVGLSRGNWGWKTRCLQCQEERGGKGDLGRNVKKRDSKVQAGVIIKLV